MPHALLLSPDDQAVSAITGVLEEMSVTCERPLDGLSAAQKLNSQSFDLVLVDCENLPAAKLIFDVCRRGKNGNNPVPIAIVDGRAGLPTAFRLGAELILTKPVAKDQARTTIRTAVSRVRKDVPANEGLTTERAHAAAASASPQLTSYGDDASSFVSSSTPNADASAGASAQSAIDELAAPPAMSRVKSPARPMASSFSESLSAKVGSADQTYVRPLVPSDDPVLAELEMAELEASQPAEAQPKSSVGKPALHSSAADSDLQVFSSYQRGRQEPRGALVALLVLALAGSGFYAAWMYQPGFRAIAQPQINRALAVAGIAHPSSSGQLVPHPPLPASPIATSAAGSAAATTPNPTPLTPADSAPNRTAVATTDSAAAPANASAQPAPGSPVAPQTAVAATPLASAVEKPEASKPTGAKGTDSNKDAAAVASPASDAPLPGENAAIILSSKGAEKRLAHSVPAKYPADAAPGGAQATIVLKEVVDENGKVSGVRLVEGDAALARAAIRAVKQWRYRPYIRDGRPQPFQTVVIVDFQRP